MVLTGNMPIEYLSNLIDSYKSRVKVLEEFLPLIIMNEDEYNEYQQEKNEKLVIIKFLEELIEIPKD
jgi:hypothetical protein